MAAGQQSRQNSAQTGRSQTCNVTLNGQKITITVDIGPITFTTGK